MGKLLIEMEGITQTIDLLPYILEESVGMGMMSAGEMETYLAIAETAGWAMLKLCKCGSDWMIFG